jgi:hypothetical protein
VFYPELAHRFIFHDKRFSRLFLLRNELF